MPIDSDYAKWTTQHAHVSAQPVQVLEFAHEDWPSSYWVTDYGVPFAGITEDARAFTAEPVAFEVQLPKSGESTQQELVLRMDALSGVVMSVIRAMTDAQRAKPIALLWRLYLDRKTTAPCADMLPFAILSIGANRTAVEMRAAASVMPMVSAGIRYTIDRFPPLAYL